MNIITFNDQLIGEDIEIFKNLPDEIQSCIYEYVKYDVFNSIYYDYNWYNNLLYLCKQYFIETMISILNENLPREKEITEGEMYDVGLYEEKVKRSIYGTRYVWIEDLADDEKATNLLIDRIDEYICSEKYNSKKMFNINIKLLTLIDNDSVYWRNDKILIYPDTDMLKTHNIAY